MAATNLKIAGRTAAPYAPPGVQLPVRCAPLPIRHLQRLHLSLIIQIKVYGRMSQQRSGARSYGLTAVHPISAYCIAGVHVIECVAVRDLLNC